MRDIRVINASFSQKTKVADVTLSFVAVVVVGELGFSTSEIATA